MVRQGRALTLDRSEYYLTSDEERLLLRIARASLVEAVCRGNLLDLSSFSLSEALKENRGAFVTLHAHGTLRGCVGYIMNCEPLALTVRDNAYNAALRDTRFDPVRPEELPHTRIEISAMTPGDTSESPFRRIHTLDDIKIGRDGLYVERPPHRGGLLLPQVAVEEDWDPQQFLDAVCRKAGYRTGAWLDPDTRLHRFSAQVFSEDDF